MAYKKDLKIATPDDGKLIWRYMDIPKYLALLENEALFFPSIEVFRREDPFEGQLSYASVSRRPEIHPELFEGKANIDQVVSEQWRYLRQVNRALKKHVVVNCWHMNGYESDAMWKLYGGGIAVRSTIGRLAASFRPIIKPDIHGNQREIDILIGAVDYRDHMLDYVDERDWLRPMLTKRKSFEHEQEVRAIAQIVPGDFGAKQYLYFSDDEPIPQVFEELYDRSGLNFPVDLSLMIEQVVVSPTMPPWTQELITKITGRYLPSVRVSESSLHVNAFWNDDSEDLPLPDFPTPDSQ